VPDVLTAAAVVIERCGLAKGAFVDPTDAVCMLGAIGEAVCGDPYGSDTTRAQQMLMQVSAEAVASVIDPENPGEFDAEQIVTDYSDDDGTQPADAVRVMRAAAEEARRG
jgi:hypothetical protein